MSANTFFLWIFLVAGISGEGIAAPLIQKIGRIELNWSNQRIRFYGFAQAETYEKSDAEAWQEGMRYLSAHLPKVRKQFAGLSQENASSAVTSVARSVYRIKTSYYKGPMVRIDMESQLPKALMALHLAHQTEEPLSAPSPHSHLVWQLDQPISPSPTMEVYDHDELIYSPQRVARSAYEKRLMGQWHLVDGTRAPLMRGGQRPLVIPARVEKGRIVVDSELWQEHAKNAEPLLSQALVTFLLPKIPD